MLKFSALVISLLFAGATFAASVLPKEKAPVCESLFSRAEGYVGQGHQDVQAVQLSLIAMDSLRDHGCAIESKQRFTKIRAFVKHATDLYDLADQIKRLSPEHIRKEREEVRRKLDKGASMLLALNGIFRNQTKDELSEGYAYLLKDADGFNQTFMEPAELQTMRASDIPLWAPLSVLLGVSVLVYVFPPLAFASAVSTPLAPGVPSDLTPVSVVPRKRARNK
jgi:hypothetical protein